MTPAVPIVLADGLDVTLYASVEDIWVDLEPWFVEQEYRLYDATGLRLELVGEPEWSVRAVEAEPTGAEELAGLLRVWLPLVGVEAGELGPARAARAARSRGRRRGEWRPPPELDAARGLGAAVLVAAAVVFALAIRAAVAGTEETVLKVVQAVAGAAAVAALLAAAVQMWRRARWWPWVAAHVALMAVAATAALIA